MHSYVHARALLLSLVLVLKLVRTRITREDEKPLNVSVASTLWDNPNPKPFGAIDIRLFRPVTMINVIQRTFAKFVMWLDPLANKLTT